MGDPREEFKNATMKRLEIVMQDPKTALQNDADQLIRAVEYVTDLDDQETWEKLYDMTKELYLKMLSENLEPGSTGRYRKAMELMERLNAYKSMAGIY